MRFTKVFTLTVHRFPKLLRETCQAFFRFFFPLSRRLAHRSQVAVQPVEGFFDELGAGHVVPLIIDEHLLLLWRCSKQIEEGLLGSLERKVKVVATIEHQQGNGHPWDEVDLIRFRLRPLKTEACHE